MSMEPFLVLILTFSSNTVDESCNTSCAELGLNWGPAPSSSSTVEVRSAGYKVSQTLKVSASTHYIY